MSVWGSKGHYIRSCFGIAMQWWGNQPPCSTEHVKSEVVPYWCTLRGHRWQLLHCAVWRGALARVLRLEVDRWAGAGRGLQGKPEALGRATKRSSTPTVKSLYREGWSGGTRLLQGALSEGQHRNTLEGHNKVVLANKQILKPSGAEPYTRHFNTTASWPSCRKPYYAPYAKICSKLP